MNTEGLFPCYDVIVVGGSYAGMAAALQLVRARRKVLIVDAGQRRNRFAATSHGVLAQDGRAPEAIAAEAKSQLLAYPTLQWLSATAVSASKQGEQFLITLDNGETVQAGRVVLATGVRDNLPAIPGLVERWGKHVFHCPYCHGYELNQGNIGVIAGGEFSFHHAMLLPDWGKVTLFTNDLFIPDEAQTNAMLARGVSIETTPVAAIEKHANVRLQDGREFEMDGLFCLTRTEIVGSLVKDLQCELVESPIGVFIQTDEFKQTSVPGVFACGDVARMAGNVSMAIGDGAFTGASVHRTMIFN